MATIAAPEAIEPGPGTRVTPPSVSALLPIDPQAKSEVRVLVVEDDPTLRETCASILRLDGYGVTLASRGDEARDLLHREPFDILLTDLCLAQWTGTALIRAALQDNPDLIGIVMTDNPSVKSSLEALRDGAWDYLPKPFTAAQLQVLVGRAAHTVLVARESRKHGHLFDSPFEHRDQVVLLGEAPAFRSVIELARRVAPTDASVFLTGESGVGKELIAQFIHRHSRRSSRPFVAVNCAALPEALLESEMFGHVKGAFTGAVRDKAGLLESANGGTMFLDELLEMPKPIQAKLLRVLQDGMLRRVGSEGTDAVVNVRFIAATNKDPDAACRSGELREDLYYRLKVVPIRVPPLRERSDDIPPLADHFLASYWTRYRRKGTPVPTWTEAGLLALRSHPWRGNVRELQNVVEHVAVMVSPGAQIGPDDIPFENDAAPVHASVSPAALSALAEDTYHSARNRVVSQFEIHYLGWLIDRAEGNLAKAARMAGVERTTLYRMMERHGLHRAPNRSLLTARAADAATADNGARS
jgi:DNA-binding NtrC family response regulator